MAAVPDFETILYEETDGVAWVTLNRPEALNAFNQTMERELFQLWTGLRTNEDVRCVVLTGAGEKAFCTGVDRNETVNQYYEEEYQNSDKRVGYLDVWTLRRPRQADLPQDERPLEARHRSRERDRVRRSVLPAW